MRQRSRLTVEGFGITKERNSNGDYGVRLVADFGIVNRYRMNDI